MPELREDFIIQYLLLLGKALEVGFKQFVWDKIKYSWKISPC